MLYSRKQVRRQLSESLGIVSINSMSCPTSLWPVLPLAMANHWSTPWSVAWPSSWCKFTWSRVLKIARIFINMCIYLFIYSAFPFLSSHCRYFQPHNIHRLTHVVMKYLVRHKTKPVFQIQWKINNPKQEKLIFANINDHLASIGMIHDLLTCCVTFSNHNL